MRHNFILICFVLLMSSESNVFAELEISTQKDKNTVRFYAKNNAYVASSISFKITVKNMHGAPEKILLVPANKANHLLFELKAKDPKKKFSFNYTYKSHIGQVNVKQAKNPIYNIPFKKGTRVKGGQGFHGKFSHQGLLAFSVDFPVPVGTVVYPARPGVVVKVIDSFSKGGTDKSFKNKGNVIWIMHADKTLGKYLHLKHKGILVKPGQKVDRNTKLGYSGNTGYSSGPHLHFEVGAANENLDFQSQEFYFSDKKGNRFTIKKGKKFFADR